jgi:sulfoxide reductase heme-binding subunit YedZ
VSPARQLTHWGNLLRLRRMLGLFAFFYALLHFTMYIFYENVSWHMILQDIAKRPYTTVGFIALLLLVPLAVTSTNRMMRRLGRRWQTLHRLIYLIPCLGVLHYWKQIKLAGREPLVYACILAVLLAWRLWRRARPALLARSAGATSRSASPRAPGKA